jgi:hypothetical protein
MPQLACSALARLRRGLPQRRAHARPTVTHPASRSVRFRGSRAARARGRQHSWFSPESPSPSALSGFHRNLLLSSANGFPSRAATESPSPSTLSGFHRNLLLSSANGSPPGQPQPKVGRALRAAGEDAPARAEAAVTTRLADLAERRVTYLAPGAARRGQRCDGSAAPSEIARLSFQR